MVLKGKNKSTGLSYRQNKGNNEYNFQEYPSYPEGDDIYSKYLKEGNLNPEDSSKTKKSGSRGKSRKNNEIDF